MTIQQHINAFIGENASDEFLGEANESAIRALINDKLKRAKTLRSIADGDVFDETTRKKLVDLIKSEHEALKRLQGLLGF